MLSASVVSNSATPWTVAHEAPLSRGALQARIPEREAVPSPLAIEPRSPALQGESLPSEPPRKPLIWQCVVTKGESPDLGRQEGHRACIPRKEGSCSVALSLPVSGQTLPAALRSRQKPVSLQPSQKPALFIELSGRGLCHHL